MLPFLSDETGRRRFSKSFLHGDRDVVESEGVFGVPWSRESKLLVDFVDPGDVGLSSQKEGSKKLEESIQNESIRLSIGPETKPFPQRLKLISVITRSATETCTDDLT